jgi:hypothetical protein
VFVLCTVISYIEQNSTYPGLRVCVLKWVLDQQIVRENVARHSFILLNRAVEALESLKAEGLVEKNYE